VARNLRRSSSASVPGGLLLIVVIPSLKVVGHAKHKSNPFNSSNRAIRPGRIISPAGYRAGGSHRPGLSRRYATWRPGKTQQPPVWFHHPKG
jgi:hypothetical protein